MAAACNAPSLEDAALARFESTGGRLHRTYQLERAVPSIVEARCRVVDDTLVRNPHFDIGTSHLIWRRGTANYRWVHLVEARLEKRDYDVWIYPPTGYMPDATSWDLSEEELGRLDAAEANRRGHVDTTYLTRRTVRRLFLHARFAVDWPGVPVDHMWSLFETYPLIDAPLEMRLRTVHSPGTFVPSLEIELPWDSTCK